MKPGFKLREKRRPRVPKDEPLVKNDRPAIGAGRGAPKLKTRLLVFLMMMMMVAIMIKATVDIEMISLLQHKELYLTEQLSSAEGLWPTS